MEGHPAPIPMGNRSFAQENECFATRPECPPLPRSPCIGISSIIQELQSKRAEVAGSCRPRLTCCRPRPKARSCLTKSRRTSKAAGGNEGACLASSSQIPSWRLPWATYFCCCALFCCTGLAAELRDRACGHAFLVLVARFFDAITAVGVWCAGAKRRAVSDITLDARDHRAAKHGERM